MSKTPNWDEAIVEPAKLRGYLLSPTHPQGKTKAAWFRRHGYTVKTLESDLLNAARSGHVAHREKSPYGTKLVVVSTFQTPAGTKIHLNSVWLIESGKSAPRLITAYPNRGGKTDAD